MQEFFINGATKKFFRVIFNNRVLKILYFVHSSALLALILTWPAQIISLYATNSLIPANKNGNYLKSKATAWCRTV